MHMSLRAGTPVVSYRSAVWTFGTTTFVASMLLFLVQPMFAKMVLPRLGGSPAVWSACVLFFQTTLLFGYLYDKSSGLPFLVSASFVLFTLYLGVGMDSYARTDAKAAAA